MLWPSSAGKCFDLLGKSFPFHTAEDCEAVLARLGAAYGSGDIQYELVSQMLKTTVYAWGSSC